MAYLYDEAQAAAGRCWWALDTREERGGCIYPLLAFRKHVTSVNAIRSSATAWESVKMLRAGLAKARKGSPLGLCGGMCRPSTHPVSWEMVQVQRR
jgi:hypothetical protein